MLPCGSPFEDDEITHHGSEDQGLTHGTDLGDGAANRAGALLGWPLGNEPARSEPVECATTLWGTALPDLGAYDKPVEFDYAAAEHLASELRATAGLLREQVPHRRSFAASAKEDWQGVYSEKFDGRMNICATDAERIAAAMTKTALQVEELARLAREEQHRRDLAKEYVKKHDEWQRKRDARDGGEKALDFLTEDIGWGDSHEPKPPDPPKSQMVHVSQLPPPASRE